VTVTFATQTKPVLLVLGSYHGINWKIVNTNNVDIVGVVYGFAESSITSDTALQVLPLYDVPIEYSAEEDGSSDFNRLLGKQPHVKIQEYSLGYVRVP
jgi:hypothetical protein